jgi:hypothetical protein
MTHRRFMSTGNMRNVAIDTDLRDERYFSSNDNFQGNMTQIKEENIVNERSPKISAGGERNLKSHQI